MRTMYTHHAEGPEHIGYLFNMKLIGNLQELEKTLLDCNFSRIFSKKALQRKLKGFCTRNGTNVEPNVG